MTTPAEEQLRDDAPPTDAPSGLPAEREEEPLGPPESRPDGEGKPARGEDAMPGIPTGGEPPSAG